jgi:hypothetical protein
MKKILIALLVLAVVAVIAIAVVMYLTGDMVDAADQFFTRVQEGDLALAYVYLSHEFRATTSIDELGSFLEGSRLAHYEGATWSSRSYENNQGRLEGTVETKGGGKIPVSVTLVKEEDVWRILSIQKAQAGVIKDDDSGTVPNLEELKGMAGDSMQQLALAINSRDFTDFHKGVSKLWQAEVTADGLYEVFRTFSDQNADLTVLGSLEPVFSKTLGIDSDGVLALKGYYQSQPSVTYFDMQYIYEHPEWKLLGIGLELR